MQAIIQSNDAQIQDNTNSQLSKKRRTMRTFHKITLFALALIIAFGMVGCQAKTQLLQRLRPRRNRAAINTRKAAVLFFWDQSLLT